MSKHNIKKIFLVFKKKIIENMGDMEVLPDLMTQNNVRAVANDLPMPLESNSSSETVGSGATDTTETHTVTVR